MSSDKPFAGDLDWDAVQTGVSLVFGLAGRILYSYPERDWLQSLLEQDLFEESPFGSEQPDIVAGLALLVGWTGERRDEIDEESLDQLKSDYSRLFIGPDRVLAAPWESVHLSVDRLLFQEQTLQVRGWYQRFGLESADLYREPDDHIGQEMAFLSHLAGMAVDALQQGNRTVFEGLVEAEQGFLSEHPLKWVPMWCELVNSHAETDFYRGIALVARGALLELAAILNVDVPPWKQVL
jgi:TorA maturation chaperone TorD